jgi:hypothetical protein
MSIIKGSGNQIALTNTPNNINSAALVYIGATAAATITVASNAAVNVYSFTIPANQYVFIEKLPTDTLIANTNSVAYATKTAYRG